MRDEGKTKDKRRKIKVKGEMRGKTKDKSLKTKVRTAESQDCPDLQPGSTL